MSRVKTNKKDFGKYLPIIKYNGFWIGAKLYSFIYKSITVKDIPVILRRGLWHGWGVGGRDSASE